MKKLILVLIVLLAIGGAVAAYYMNKTTPEPTVTTAQITRGDIVETVGATVCRCVRRSKRPAAPVSGRS